MALPLSLSHPSLPILTHSLITPSLHPLNPLLQTVLELTPFCDAVSRGDVEMANYLLEDARVDPHLGSRVVARPALYAAMTGNTEMLRAFCDAKLIGDDIEQALYKTAAANGHTETLQFVENVSD